MDSQRTIVALVLLCLIATARCELPQPRDYQSLEAEPAEKQFAAIGSLLFSLAQPVFSNALSSLTTNLGSAITNAFSATLAGKELELIPLEILFAEPIKESTTPASNAASIAAPTYKTGGDLPKRLPHRRSIIHDSHPKASGSS